MTREFTAPQVDLAKEQRAVRRQAALAFTVCVPALALASLILPRFFEFPTSLADRMAFGLRANLVLGLWVLLAVRMVANERFESAADNAGSAFGQPSARLAVPAAFLQNTLEQAFVAALGMLALATARGEAALAYIVGAVVLFSVGRIAFLRGYPRGAGGRAFGIATTALPIIGAYGWAIVDIAANLLR
jgi:MAPEG family